MDNSKLISVLSRLISLVIAIAAIVFILNGVTNFDKTPEKVGIGVGLFILALFVNQLMIAIGKKLN